MLAQLEREFDEVNCDYTGPRIDEEGCTDEEDEVAPFPVVHFSHGRKQKRR